MIKIFLTQGKHALIDDIDYPLVSRYVWRYSIAGCAITNIKKNGIRKTIKMHRFILNLTDPCLTVDHINHDRLDNRRNNLRIATIAENSRNRKPRGRSKYVGVGYAIQGNYKGITSRIWVNNKRIHLGTFNTEEEAAKAYDEAAKKYFGEFAYLNFR